MRELIENIAVKLFRGLDMSWKKVFLFALGAAVYTALMALLVPQTSSFHDIVVTSEIWALFAIVIFMNCSTPKEAAAKVVSQVKEGYEEAVQEEKTQDADFEQVVDDSEPKD